jgi:hypothetical protein
VHGAYREASSVGDRAFQLSRSLGYRSLCRKLSLPENFHGADLLVIAGLDRLPVQSGCIASDGAGSRVRIDDSLPWQRYEAFECRSGAEDGGRRTEDGGMVFVTRLQLSSCGRWMGPRAAPSMYAHSPRGRPHRLGLAMSRTK